MKIDALLDTNVVIAMLVEAHEHHAPSLALLTADKPARYAAPRIVMRRPMPP